MKKTIPNILSFLRVVISPVFLIMFISEKPAMVAWSSALFYLAAVTDYFDGWLARKLKVTGPFGAFLDPLADKFLTTAAFCGLLIKGVIPFWMLAVFVLRDVATTVLRIVAKTDRPMVTSKSAKVKTFLQMTILSIILALFAVVSQNVVVVDQHRIFSMIYSPYTYYSLFALTVLTVWTLVEYVHQTFKSE